MNSHNTFFLIYADWMFVRPIQELLHDLQVRVFQFRKR